VIALVALQLVAGGAHALVAKAPDGFSVSAEDCRGCHRAAYDQWRKSRHARAWTNPLFTVSFRREPMRWCVYCHSPLVEQVAQVGSARQVEPGAYPLADEGVTCAACHVRDGHILSARTPSERATTAHPMIVEPRLGVELCAGCHQFNFPHERSAKVSYTDAPMQNTVAEWRASGDKRACSACHPAHEFPGATLVRDSVSITVTRPAIDRVAITLRARGAAHRVPTGDPFRRLVVELRAPDSDVPLATPAFGRSFRRDGDAWRLARDFSLPPDGEIRRELKIPPTPVVEWRLSYKMAAPSTEPDLSPTDHTIPLADGKAIAP
jgi:hypothetical protein